METIDYQIGTYYGETEEVHTWKINDEQGVAAELYVSIDHAEIGQIEVREDRRGEGLARALYEAAYAQLGVIYHSLPAHCTPEGLAFAEAMGGEVAEECHMTDVCTCSI